MNSNTNNIPGAENLILPLQQLLNLPTSSDGDLQNQIKLAWQNQALQNQNFLPPIIASTPETSMNTTIIDLGELTPKTTSKSKSKSKSSKRKSSNTKINQSMTPPRNSNSTNKTYINPNFKGFVPEKILAEEFPGPLYNFNWEKLSCLFGDMQKMIEEDNPENLEDVMLLKTLRMVINNVSKTDHWMGCFEHRKIHGKSKSMK